MIDLLLEPAIRFRGTDQAAAEASLPEILAALAADRVESFPALRAHQRHAWHAFLCQVATLALIGANHDQAWQNAAAWRDALAALTPGQADTAWSLVAAAEHPALLQPPIPGGTAALKSIVATPDALDMLVTSRNHDLKAARMQQAATDDWLFALVTLQTMEGSLGAGNYGVSRMNGGFASRPALGVAPDGLPGRGFVRDVGRLLALRGRLRTSSVYATSGGLALLWLPPWDGAASLQPGRLDEYYVEICRRVRLVAGADGRLSALAGGSKAPRVAPTPGGLTGDPWAPLMADGAGRKVFTANAGGFHYRQMVKLLWPEGGNEAPLQEIAATDANDGLAVVARALVRGQGKTEGYHERRVLLSKLLLGRRLVATDPEAQAASERSKLASGVGRCLEAALLSLFQGGPAKIDFRDKDGVRKAEPLLRRLDAEIDRTFFEDLWLETDVANPAAATAERRRWVRGLLDRADAILTAAEASAPKASRRRLRAAVNARDVLHGMARGEKSALAEYLKPEPSDARRD